MFTVIKVRGSGQMAAIETLWLPAILLVGRGRLGFLPGIETKPVEAGHCERQRGHRDGHICAPSDSANHLPKGKNR